MIIVGIDPGIGRAGWGIIEVKGGKLEVKGYGCIETTKDQEMGERIKNVYDEVFAILGESKADALAIEELFFNTNVTTAFAVGQARGVILLAAQQFALPVTSYTPQQIKIGVTGYGRSDKKQVGQMVKTILKLQTLPKLDDTTDALAIAITHAFSYKIKKV
jgi:crossover junction endodeoxyribonuclease RuvC